MNRSHSVPPDPSRAPWSNPPYDGSRHPGPPPTGHPGPDWATGRPPPHQPRAGSSGHPPTEPPTVILHPVPGPLPGARGPAVATPHPPPHPAPHQGSHQGSHTAPYTRPHAAAHHPAAPPRSGRPARTPKILAAVAAVLVLAGGAAAMAAANGAFTPVFRQDALQAGVAEILTHHYGLTVRDVSCPTERKAFRGNSFDCQATIDGQRRAIEVRVEDDEGGYTVDRPR